MFSMLSQDDQLPSLSRSSSDRSDSSTGCHPVSMQSNNQVDNKMYSSNLYWEEENLSSDPGQMDPPPWDMDIKNSSSLELELSLDLAKKLLLARESPGSEGTQRAPFNSSFPPPGGSSSSNPRFKTEICRNYKEKGTCLYGELCQFAHGKHELRKDVVRHNKYKTKLCQKYWMSGYCAYGPRCNFIHDTDRRHVMTNQSGNITGLRAPGNVTTAYYKTAAEVIAAVKKTNLTESGSEDGGNFNYSAPFLFTNPYRTGGNLMGLDKFPTFYPQGYNMDVSANPTCGPIGSGRPSEKINMPGV